MIRPDMSLKEIAGAPEFSGYEFMVGEMPGIPGRLISNIKLETMCRLTKTWNAQSLADGMEYLARQVRKKKVFYDFWTQEEKKADPSKEMTGLAALTVSGKAKFVVICAGGGYASVCSMAEAYPIAQELNRKGYAAFVVQYRVGKDAAAPNPMDDLAQAIRFILRHADEFQVDTRDYAIAGFSAGGHLAASMGTEQLGYIHYGLPKPGALFLAYPVVTMGEKTHKGSRKNLLGKSHTRDLELIRKYSVEKQITSSYPPSFVWQFEQDNAVPIENTRMLVKELNQKKIENVYETFLGTAHGVGLGKGTVAEGWLDHAVRFWESRFSE